jgi:hypothetical protein
MAASLLQASLLTSVVAFGLARAGERGRALFVILGIALLLLGRRCQKSVTSPPVDPATAPVAVPNGGQAAVAAPT